MRFDNEPARGPAELLVSRRAVLAGIITLAVAPAALAKASALGPGQAPVHSVGPGHRGRKVARQHHTTTQTTLGTVMAGGFHNGALASVQLFDGQEWHDLPPMLTPRYQHAAIPFEGGLLVAGGLSWNGLPMTSVEGFDGIRWRKLPSLKVARIQHAAVLWGARPMVIGGLSGVNGYALTSVEAFDGAGWEPLAPLSLPRYGHTAVVNGELITVNGGSYLGPVTTSESFDGLQWTRIEQRSVDVVAASGF